MAVSGVSPGNPAATFAALNTWAQAINSALALADQLNSAVGALQAGASSEALTRGLSDAGLSARLDAHTAQITQLFSLSPQLAQTISALNSIQQALIATDNRAAATDARADMLADQIQDGADRADGLAVSIASISAALTSARALADMLVTRRRDYQQATFRPGDVPDRFAWIAAVADLTGDGNALPGIPSAAMVKGDNGRAVRITGSGILVSRQGFAVEPSRFYRARFVIQRRTNPSDPSNDAVRLAIVWRDQSGFVLSGAEAMTLVEEFDDLRVVSGRQERLAVFSRAASADSTFRSPARARSAHFAVIHYGLDGATDVEVLGCEDITSGLVLPPVSADTVARVDALVSQNLDPRVSAIESQISGPNSLTLPTKSDASSATIPESVTTVELRGSQAPGDGGGGLYVRAGQALGPGDDGFTSGGAAWIRVTIAQAVFNATMDRLLPGWFAALPVLQDGGAVPVSAGKPFNNGGSLNFA